MPLPAAVNQAAAGDPRLQDNQPHKSSRQRTRPVALVRRCAIAKRARRVAPATISRPIRPVQPVSMNRRYKVFVRAVDFVADNRMPERREMRRESGVSARSTRCAFTNENDSPFGVLFTKPPHDQANSSHRFCTTRDRSSASNRLWTVPTSALPAQSARRPLLLSQSGQPHDNGVASLVTATRVAQQPELTRRSRRLSQPGQRRSSPDRAD